MKSLKDLFKEEEFAKYIFIRGLMEDNLKKEMYKEFSLYKGLTLDQLIDRTRLIEKIQRDAESLTSDSNSEDTRHHNRSKEKHVNFNAQISHDRPAPNNNNNANNYVNNHNNNTSNNSNHNQRNPQNNSNHNNFNRSQHTLMSPKPTHQQQQSSPPANQGPNNLNAGISTAEH
jgi:hypothetical protein